MRLFVVLIVMAVFLQFHLFLLLASSNCSSLDIQQRRSITEAVAEDGRKHIAAISKKGGGGGGHGGGGGRGGGGRGGRGGRGRGGMLPFYGAAGAAAAHGSRTHHRGSTCRSAQFGWTLPALVVGLGTCLIQFHAF